MAAKKKSSSPSYGKKASDKVEEKMHEMKQGTLRSGGSGKKVTDPKQAIAIGLSEARREGGKVPPAPNDDSDERKSTDEGSDEQTPAKKKASKKKASKKKASKKAPKKKASKKKASKKKASKKKASKKAPKKASKRAPKKRSAAKKSSRR